MRARDGNGPAPEKGTGPNTCSDQPTATRAESPLSVDATGEREQWTQRLEQAMAERARRRAATAALRAEMARARAAGKAARHARRLGGAP